MRPHVFVGRADKVFSRGGLFKSGEGGPAILPCCHIKPVSLSQWEKESEEEEREGQVAAGVRKKR